MIAFELLGGERPFPGPEVSDFRKQHLDQAPLALTGIPPWLASLVGECLYKAPQARPTAASILTRLRANQRTPSAASARLQAVNAALVERQSHESARESARTSDEEQRAALRIAARQSLDRVLNDLLAAVLDAAPAAIVTRTPVVNIRLGEAILLWDPVADAPVNCLNYHGQPPPFDVIAYSAMAVRKPRDHYGYDGRSHSLWFCDAHDQGLYRWFETAFMIVHVAESSTLDPFALTPTDPGAASAFGHVIGSRQVAWEPVPIDQGEEAPFIERWLGWPASAADGSLRHPHLMPKESGGHHRG